MIDFLCPCGRYKFSLPDDMAGGMIQCPRCRRLNDVPVPSEMASIEEDGSYKLEDEPVTPSNDAVLSRLGNIFTERRVDEDGKDIDLRNAPSTFAKVGGESIAIEETDIVNDAPKYDPFTGELIRPVVVKKSAPPAARKVVDPLAMPLGPKPAKRRRRDEEEKPEAAELFAIPFKLLAPINLLVMTLILVGHLASQALLIVVGMGFLIVAPAFPILQALFFSHYGNVIDETGPSAHHELPAPLRSVSWYDDIGGPLIRMVVALTFCYGPAMLVLFTDFLPLKISLPLSAALAIVATPFAPAMMLTAITSGTWMNLHPRRVISVITASGGEYLLPLLLWAIAAPAYLVSTTLLDLNALGWGLKMLSVGVQLPPSVAALTTTSVGKSTLNSQWLNWTGEYIALVAAIFAMHWMCWCLGLLYRRHHAEFDWAFQRHIKKNPADTLPPNHPGLAVNRNSEKAKRKMAASDAPKAN